MFNAKEIAKKALLRAGELQKQKKKRKKKRLLIKLTAVSVAFCSLLVISSLLINLSPILYAPEDLKYDTEADGYIPLDDINIPLADLSSLFPLDTDANNKCGCIFEIVLTDTGEVSEIIAPDPCGEFSPEVEKGKYRASLIISPYDGGEEITEFYFDIEIR